MFRFDRGEFESAIEPCQRVVELTPWSAQAHQNLGAALGKAGRMAEARHEFKRAIDIEPRPVALKNLAKIYLDTGDYATAAKYYEQARDKSQSDYRIWMDLAGAYEVLADSRAADAYAKVAMLAQQRLDVNPELHDLWPVIAHCWAGAGKPSEALVWLKRETERIDRSPGRKRALNAATYAMLGNRTECLRWVKLALESADGRADVASSR